MRPLIDGYGGGDRAPGDRRRCTCTPEIKRAGEKVVAYSGSVTHHRAPSSDFAVLGELMLRLADQDQTTISGPWWELRPGSPVHREVRRAAIADAISVAREYAEALGARVVALVEVADSGMQMQPMMMARASFAEAADAGMPSIELDPQVQTAHATIEARFVISTPTAIEDPVD